MNLRPPILLAVLAVVLMLCLAASARRLTAAQADLEAGYASLQSVADEGRRVLELRARQQRVAERKRPEQDVIARVNAVLAEAGIPANRFAGLRPDSDAALPGAGEGGPQYRRQTVQVMLRQLTVPELGAFLGGWSVSQDLWTPARIELTHTRDRTNPRSYDVTMAISAIYVSDS